MTAENVLWLPSGWCKDNELQLGATRDVDVMNTL